MTRTLSIDMDAVNQMLADGASVAQVAVELGVKDSTLRGHMSRAGIEPPNNHHKVAQQMVLARSMAAQGRSVREIAAALGILVATAKWRLKRWGIVTNPPRTSRPARKVSDEQPQARPAAADDEPEVEVGPEMSPIDRELAATGGSYAALALVAERHGLTSVQARSRWHRLGLSVTVVR